MRLNCLQEDLAYGLGVVKRAVATRSVLPVLSNVMLSTDGDRLKLSATDLEIGINCWVEAVTETEGSTTVPARSFTDWVNSLPHEPVYVELDESTETLKLKCSSVKANFKGISAEEFPIIPIAKEVVPIDASLFREMVSQVSMAAAQDESRPILEGVLLEATQDKMTMAAADGFRLATRSIQPNIFNKDMSVIIPATTLNEAAKLGCTELQLNERQAIFQGKDFNVISQLIEGQFPTYEQIIPKEFTTEVTVDTQALLVACKRIQVFAREAANLAKLKIEPEGIGISSVGTEIGDCQDVIPSIMTGKSLEIGINVKYLVDALSTMPAGDTILRMNSPSNPVMLVPSNKDIDLIVVIMPMQVR